MPKRKPVTWSDRTIDGKPNPEVVEKNFTYRQYPATGTGQVRIVWACLFCPEQITGWLWSLCGGGRRCPSCKAMYSGYGNAIQWKDKVA